MTLIKEMEYSRDWKTEILARGFYKDYEYLCVSYGCHPCAYIAISEGQPYYKAKSYDEVEIDCHGGCTYAEWGYSGIFNSNYKVIGWDYGHCNDYSGIYEKDSPLYNQCKKWTTQEMIEECKEVIERLYRLEHFETFYK